MVLQVTFKLRSEQPLRQHWQQQHRWYPDQLRERNTKKRNGRTHGLTWSSTNAHAPRKKNNLKASINAKPTLLTAPISRSSKS